MNLIIDIGNTLSKVVVFDNSEIIHSKKYDSLTTNILKSVLDLHKEIDYVIVSCVGKQDEEIFSSLNKQFKEKFIIFNSLTPTKIINDYHTPQTLGVDRLAAAQGACTLFGIDKNMLIFDFGTAITIDFVEQGHFKGGNISLGATLRFKALNNYTERLPLLSLTEEISLVGKTTNAAIENGVINSIIFEIEGYISHFKKEFKDIIIIFTGGDAKYFAGKLKNTIFAYSDLVPIGLNDILNNNKGLI